MRHLPTLHVKGEPTVFPDHAICRQFHYFIYRPRVCMYVCVYIYIYIYIYMYIYITSVPEVSVSRLAEGSGVSIP